LTNHKISFIINLMKKLALSLMSCLSYLSFVPLAHAQSTCDNTGVFKNICELGNQTGGVGKIVGSFAQLFFILAAVIAVLYLLYGGIKWITSKGEKTEVESARGHIVAAITGLIVVFLAFFIINFVLGFLIPGFSINNIALPQLTERAECKTNLQISNDTYECVGTTAECASTTTESKTVVKGPECTTTTTPVCCRTNK